MIAILCFVSLLAMDVLGVVRKRPGGREVALRMVFGMVFYVIPLAALIYIALKYGSGLEGALLMAWAIFSVLFFALGFLLHGTGFVVAEIRRMFPVLTSRLKKTLSPEQKLQRFREWRENITFGLISRDPDVLAGQIIEEKISEWLRSVRQVAMKRLRRKNKAVGGGRRWRWRG